MEQQGFSFIEVLLSLMLATTLCIALLQQQMQSRQLLHHFMTQTKDALVHDTSFEHVWSVKPRMQRAP